MRIHVPADEHAMDATIPCPKCHESFTVPLVDISPGKTASCPSCGNQITFAGQDAAKVQNVIDQLVSQVGAGSVKVTVKAKVRRPWWKVWG
jgi:hypothetical protein